VRRALLACLTLLCCAGVVSTAEAASTCTFVIEDATMRLAGDCTADAPIVVPDGMTFDGDHHTIVAIDPPNHRFRGAVITNGGASASVIDTNVSAAALADACLAGAERLRGIYFEGASGTIRGNTVTNVNKGASACAEGNAIEVRNASLSGEATRVEIDHNLIDAYQKSGIVVTGRVEAHVHHNEIGASATQAYQAANAIQIGAWARADIEENLITGNSSPTSDAAGTAILLVGCAEGTSIVGNRISGNSDVGIYIAADAVSVQNNRVTDAGPDGYYDVGIGNYGLGNLFSGNIVRGFARPMEGVETAGGKDLRVATLE
jgi:parallel beta-helix repeat protein